MTDNAWEARLLSFLNARLPEKEPERTRAALRIASEKQCQAIAGIVGERDCKCLGVHWITWASLWLATDDLKGSRGKPEIVSRFVGMDSEVLEKALHRGQVGSDERLQGRIDLIRRWLVRRPANQWEAWADVEDILGDTW